MKNQKDVMGEIVRESYGLRFENLGELESQTVTIKKFPSGRLVIQPGRATTATPHVTVAVIGGIACGAKLLAFTKEAFKGERAQMFIAAPTPLQNGGTRVDYYQM